MKLRHIGSYKGGYPFAIAAACLAVAVLVPFREVLATPVVMLLLVPVIVLVARISGVGPSATASVISFLLLDFLFLQPYYRFAVAELPEWIGLIVFLFVALVSGQQTGQLRRRELAAVRRQRELELMNRLSSALASESSAEATAELVVGQVADLLGARRTALYVGASDPAMSGRCLAQAGALTPSSGEEALVAWVLRTGTGIGPLAPAEAGDEARRESVAPGDAIPGVAAEGVYLPLRTATSLEGVLVAIPDNGGEPSAEEIHLLDAVANLAASAIARQRLEEDAARAEALREADRLKSTLVSSVSHELKTPLAAATARVTGLIEEGEGCDAARVQQELEAVAEDLDRLNDAIGDLLDFSRLESDAWQPHFDAHDVRDILGTVLERVPSSQRGRVDFELAEHLPDVRADFSQLARAISNLVENALYYSPQDSVVTVGARPIRDAVMVWVADSGPGVSDEEKPKVFEKFYRGEASSGVPSGTGLGLAIAREIVRTHDGTLQVEDVDPHGARFTMIIPSAGEERR